MYDDEDRSYIIVATLVMVMILAVGLAIGFLAGLSFAAIQFYS